MRLGRSREAFPKVDALVLRPDVFDDAQAKMMR